MESSTYDELKKRINNELKHKDCDEKMVICWFGYLAALIEWKLISIEEHRQLCEMLPVVEDNPSLRILLG